ncbi:MAG: FeoB-associated Cys-rich membrane protein [Ruminococcaceae bacterium]|nr:FeoB-associated Cys-rich membrane protein [Oscillospiraceae bacterium]
MGDNIVPIIIIAIIVGLAVAYIIKAKKSGKKCIGCPDSSACSGKCSSCSCGCSSKESEEQN